MGRKRDGLARRRSAVGYSQERLAHEVGVEKSTVWRWEAGKSDPQPFVRPDLAAALKITEEALQDLLFPATDVRTPVTPASTAMPPVGLAPLAALQAFRAADIRSGGGKLYTRVMNYLATELGPGLFNPNAGGREIFSAAAGLTEMAGWMAHDAGDDTTAEQHFRRALELASISGDHQLTAHIYASLAHLALNQGDSHRAAAYGQAGGKTIAGRHSHTAIRARLHAMIARSAAMAGERAACWKHLRASEALVAASGRISEPLSPWTSDFDHGSLASEAARCFRHLGDLSEAERQARRVIELRPPSRARSRAFGQLALADIHLARREPEPASQLARAVLAETEQLSSALVAGQLHSIADKLAPYHATPDVVDFLQRHQSALARTLETGSVHD